MATPIALAPPHWIQLVFELESAVADELEAALEACGALAISYADRADQPLYEPAPGETPLWEELRLSALFDAAIDTTQLANELNALYPGDLPPYKTELVEDKDWVRAWMDQFQPIPCGAGLWICPSWHRPPEPDAVNLMLDPGMAFGTGTHPTTRLCLEWLATHKPENNTLIDYGCGSGILAIAALMLGAQHAWAVDIDPQALEATSSNAANNHITPTQIHIALAQESEPPAADLVIANILAGPLQQLAPRLADLTHAGGQLILSGILVAQAADVMAAYQRWFSFAPVREKDGWVLLEGRKA